MALTVESLLAPVSEDNPVGEDLSYDNERGELERVFESSESSDPDAADAGDRDWRAVQKLIESQFARTKDVWLAVYLCRAGVESGALDVVVTGTEVLAGLFEQYWPTVHPQLEELGLPGRKAPCDALTNRKLFITPLERLKVFAHPRMGVFTAADVQRFAAEGSAADGYGQFRAALDDLGPDPLVEALSKLEEIDAALHRADRVFTTEAAGEDSPNYAATYAALAALKTGLRTFVPSVADEAPEEEADVGAGAPGGGRAAGGALSGALNSRDDVVKALEMLMTYYRQREPGHPMVVLLERARQWVGMDFITLMKDIAPDGLDQAEKLLRTRSGVLEGGS